MDLEAAAVELYNFAEGIRLEAGIGPPIPVPWHLAPEEVKSRYRDLVSNGFTMKFTIKNVHKEIIGDDAEAIALYDFSEQMRVLSGFTSTGKPIPWEKAPTWMKTLFQELASSKDPLTRETIRKMGEEIAQELKRRDHGSGGTQPN